jgi:hypothetical protein
VQVNGTNGNSAAQLLQQLINSIETRGAAASSDATPTGQNVQGASAGDDQSTPTPPPPSSFANQFSPSSLAFLTSLQSSDSSGQLKVQTVNLAGLEKGMNDLASALKEIQGAVTSGTGQTQSTGTTSLTSSTLSAQSISLTSSTLATALNQLESTLLSLENGSQTQSSHHHHHHHTEAASNTDSSSSTSSSSTTSTASTTSTDSTDQTTNAHANS